MHCELYVVGLILGWICYCSGESKYGCPLPEQPMFGKFKFNDRRKTLEYVCDQDFTLMPPVSRWDTGRQCDGGKWTGRDHDCVLDFRVQRQCPRLYPPTNGRVYVSGYQKGDKARYSCDIGYALEGQEEIECLEYQAWSGLSPICRSFKNAADIALSMKEKFIDRFAGTSVTSDNGAQARLSVGKSGLDIVMAVDTSASIGPVALATARQFMKILVDIFGVSNSSDGGGNGTRFAFVTFAAAATVVSDLDDTKARTKEAVHAIIDKITNTGGGTSLSNALDVIFQQIYMNQIRGKNRSSSDTNRAVFVLTDAEETVDQGKHRITQKSNLLENYGFEIFALGVGRNIDRQTLRDIASEPPHDHVFFIDDFADLKKIGDIIAERNIDFGECGKQGKANIKQDTGAATKGAWPWVGWIGAREKLCGGALLCDQFFITAARCVSELNETTKEVVPYPAHEISVSLGIIELFKRDNEEQMTYPAKIILHPNYTGIPVKYDIRINDVAILDLGDVNKTRPTLNAFIKPICFPYRKLLNFSSPLLKDLKSLEHGKANGFTAGWGLMPEQHRQIPWNELSQNRRSIQSDRVCGLMYPGLDTERVFCVGNILAETEKCRGDVGGVYMAELQKEWRYTALGINLRSFDCEKDRHFSVFLNLHHPDITEWMESVLGHCNRLGSVEEARKEEEKERLVAEEAMKEEEKRLADAKAKQDEEERAEKARKEAEKREKDEAERLKAATTEAEKAANEEDRQNEQTTILATTEAKAATEGKRRKKEEAKTKTTKIPNKPRNPKAT